MRFAIPQKQVSINWSLWLLWIAITLLFLYERTYLIQKVGLPHLVECVVVRVSLLMLVCYIHTKRLVLRLFLRKKYGQYGLLTILLVGAYLLMQGAYDQYLFGYVIGDQERTGLWQNLPYNGIVTVWYLLLTYLLSRTATAPDVDPVEPARPPVLVTDQVLTIKTGTQWVQLPVDQVLYAQGLKDYTVVFTRQKKYIVKGSIGKIADWLPDGLFVRVHKSYIVATRHIQSVSTSEIRLDNHPIPVGRSYLATVQKKLM